MTSILIEMHKRLPVVFEDLMEQADLSIALTPLVDSVIDATVIAD